MCSDRMPGGCRGQCTFEARQCWGWVGPYWCLFQLSSGLRVLSKQAASNKG